MLCLGDLPLSSRGLHVPWLTRAVDCHLLLQLCGALKRTSTSTKSQREAKPQTLKTGFKSPPPSCLPSPGSHLVRGCEQESRICAAPEGTGTTGRKHPNTINNRQLGTLPLPQLALGVLPLSEGTEGGLPPPNPLHDIQCRNSLLLLHGTEPQSFAL